MNIAHYAQFTCWTSIVALLWGMIVGWIKPSFVSWFAFVFFVVSTIIITMYNIGTKRPQ